MSMPRRHFLKMLSAAAVLPALSLPACSLAASSRWYSACTNRDGEHFIAAMNGRDSVFWKVPVSHRGHASVLNPVQSQVLLMGRRPDPFAWLVNTQTGELEKKVESGAQRHFYGHGVFSKDGRYLWTTENNIDTLQGVIVVRDAHAGYEIVDEFSSFGIGPHELAWMPDGKTLVVANGGIKTHPDEPRKKLNLDSMSPSLTYIDATSKNLLGHFYPNNPQASIRHLTVTPSGTVAAIMQYQGVKTDKVPLIALHRGESSLQYLKQEDEFWSGLGQYTASAVADPAGGNIIVTTPRGGQAILIDEHSGDVLDQVRIADCAGAGFVAPGIALITNGLGEVSEFNIKEDRLNPKARFRLPNIKWDNHLLVA